MPSADQYKGMKIFGHVATKSQAESTDKSIWIVEGDSPHIGRYHRGCGV